MQTIVLMCIGIAVGKWVFPKKWGRANSFLQTALTILLIFVMGVTIGKDDDLLQNLASIGLDSMLFCLIPTALSLLLVYILSKRILDKTRGDK